MLIDGELRNDCSKPTGQRTATGVVGKFACRLSVLANAKPVQFRPD
jgi:hypothetical protein